MCHPSCLRDRLIVVYSLSMAPALGGAFRNSLLASEAEFGMANLHTLLKSYSHELVTLTTFSDGCLGSNNDEGRSEMR